MEAHIKAHKYCRSHMERLKKDRICGCFYCLSIYSPERIEEWLIADTDADRLGTALCPFCGIDAVIGESSGFPITKEFLKKMSEYWFS